MGIVVKTFLLSSLFVASFASAAITSTSPTVYIFCKRYSEVRTLRIEESKGQCVAYYNKEGHERKVGAGSSMAICQASADKILDVLKGVAWNCTPVKDARVYTISSTPTKTDEPERLSDFHAKRVF